MVVLELLYRRGWIIFFKKRSDLGKTKAILCRILKQSQKENTPLRNLRAHHWQSQEMFPSTNLNFRAVSKTLVPPDSRDMYNMFVT